jgi:hypothetical protein
VRRNQTPDAPQLVGDHDEVGCERTNGLIDQAF